MKSSSNHHQQQTASTNQSMDVKDLLVVQKTVAAYTARKKTSAAVRTTKQTARKSTSKYWDNVEEYSFYGSKPEEYDPKTTMTTIVVSGIEMKLSVDQVQ